MSDSKNLWTQVGLLYVHYLLFSLVSPVRLAMSVTAAGDIHTLNDFTVFCDLSHNATL